MASPLLILPLYFGGIAQSVLLSLYAISITFFTFIILIITFIFIPTPTMVSLGKYTGHIIEEEGFSDLEEEGPLTPIQIMKQQSRDARRRKSRMNERFWDGVSIQDDMRDGRRAREAIIKRKAAKELKRNQELLRKWKAKQAKVASSN
ncbi:hypothetical protein TWF694_011242 [Orbilia ellipsospora]|uniref:Uncharacterized protein n=1 Tax=Orbilia ellipsospora TaxID=2528407 RepID=A0AAV9X9M8_9PEZI